MQNLATSRWSVRCGSAVLALASVCFAGHALAAKSGSASDHPAGYEQVMSISTLGGFHDFDVIDRNTLIVWSNPFKPYLIELATPSVELGFVRAIGVKSGSDRLYSGFDSVIVDGRSYAISRIYKLSRDEARALAATDSGSADANESGVSG